LSSRDNLLVRAIPAAPSAKLRIAAPSAMNADISLCFGETDVNRITQMKRKATAMERFALVTSYRSGIV
jgi:hypothetical protein